MKNIVIVALAAALLTGCQEKTQAVSQANTTSTTTNTTAATPAPTPSTSPTNVATEVDIAPDSPKLGHIVVEPVKIADVPEAEVTAPGSVEANPNQITHVNLSAPGRVTKVLVKLGDFVRQGQPLLTIASPEASEAQAALREADAEVRQAHATLLEANVNVGKARTELRKVEADYRRVRELYKHDAIAQKEVLVAETELKQARADVQSALALVDHAQGDVDGANAMREQALAKLRLLGVGARDPNPQIVVTSPLSGKVLEIKVVAGEYYTETGSSLLTIADLSSVWVVSNVPETAIRNITEGEPVKITFDAFPGETFKGTVARIADVLDPKTRTVKVMTTLANSHGRFRPEMFGRIHHEHKIRRFPVIPATAVLQQGSGRQTVFVEEGRGQFESREVDVGTRVGDRVAVTRGLKPGERVVVDGAVLLRK